MEYAYSVVMFCIAGGLFIYAGLLAVTKSPALIRRMNQIKVKDERRYAVQFAKTMAIIAAAFLVSGLVGLTKNTVVAIIVLVVGLIGGMIAAVKLTADEFE